MPQPSERPGSGWQGRMQVKQRILSRKELRTLLRAQGWLQPVPDARRPSPSRLFGAADR